MPAEDRGAVSPAVRALLRRRVFGPIDVLLAVTAVGCGLVALGGGTVPFWVQILPFALSLVLFGLPHGAIDHLVPGRLAGITPTQRSKLAVVGVYLVLGAVTLGAWALAPGVAFVLFIALTWFHWGQGDLFHARALEWPAGSRIGPASRILLVAVRGGIPMLVPLIAHPAEFAAVASASVLVLGGHDAHPAAMVVDPRIRLALAVGLLLLVVAERGLALGAVSGRSGRRTWVWTTGETLLLLALFVLAPAVLAVGLYFTTWHALRHIVRLQLLDPPSVRGLAAGRPAVALRRFALAAAPLTVVALGMLVLLAVLRPPGDDPQQALGVYLVLISALTVPHVVVVALMDRRQRVWRDGAVAALSPADRLVDAPA